MSGPERILVVGPSWVGDMVMAQALFGQLAREHPGALIDVVAPAWSEAILSRMPEVRHAITLDTGHGELGFRKRRRLGRALRAGNYHRAIVVPRSFKSALVPWFAKVPRRTGFTGEMRFGLLNDRRRLDRPDLDQTVKRFVSLAVPADAPLPPVRNPALRADPENQSELLRRLGLSTAGGAVALMPGAAYGPAKCWPLEYFAELARALTARGRQVWVLGSQGERADGERVVAGAGSEARNLCGETRLGDTVDLLALARVAVSNDSGLMHVAAAAGCHVIGIYGSSSPRFTPPLTDNRTVLWREEPCSPCFRRECPLGHLDCLKLIHPSEVLAAAMAQLPAT